MKFSTFFRSALIVLTLLAAACSSTPDKDYIPPENPLNPNDQQIQARLLRLKEDVLYKAAHQSLENADFGTAIKRYDDVTTRYPFSEYATQSELERIYAYYRNYQPDEALVAADHFLRDHPRHPAAAYVQYLKGLVNSDRVEGLDNILNLDTTKEDVSYSRSAFDDFSVLVQKYPGSIYTGDARQRMIYLRNRIAEHELHIVRFYMKRRAYIAAAKRAEDIVTQYPGAPATLDALRLLESATTELGLKDQAAEAQRLLQAQLAAPVPKNDYPQAAHEPGMFARMYARLFSHDNKTADTPPAPPSAAPATDGIPKSQDHSAPTPKS
ncbi:MAG: outer membrane protein assembly factor BamD [Stenotrophobium sp.]